MIIVCKLKHVLIDINMSQSKLALLVGITEANMNKIANGKSMPRVDTALLIAHFCGKAIDEIWQIKFDSE